MNDKILTRAFWMLLHKGFERQIAAQFTRAFAKTVMRNAKTSYCDIMRRQLPLIGPHNPKLVDILLAALAAAIYQVGNRQISVAQMDSILVNGLESSTLFVRSFQKSNHFCQEWQDKRHAQALLSRQKKYPADFVCDFTYGKTCEEYGITYYECAIYHLLQREGCPELASLFCQFDYVMAKHMNARLDRTQTLVDGGHLCDFWYTKLK